MSILKETVMVRRNHVENVLLDLEQMLAIFKTSEGVARQYPQVIEELESWHEELEARKAVLNLDETKEETLWQKFLGWFK